ncbi:acyl-CoA dehydrogenase family protein [Alicyclobacillus sendaiensis]|uniref:acyl-CoA dehydrogenase family protein n=1 Tax=Alicyclobacillus sendaiensis TaxID=192387 RepID=UPI0026F436E4|nr:acyl-CoA dehydrogenase family protein [Alicyclobacillus sendaiensis]
MDFRLTREQRMVQQTVREFVKEELIPLENEILNSERIGRKGIESEYIKTLQKKARDIGFWGISTPEEYGGANFGPLMTAIVRMELGRTFIPFTFGGDADNILFHCNDEQKERFLIPVINGEKQSCFALTEPQAGSDVASIRMTAKKSNCGWILNGEKIFITNGNTADFAIVFAVTDKESGPYKGITCFLVERERGWRSEPIYTMGERTPASLIFENVEVPDENVLGPIGEGLRLAMQWIIQGRWIIAARAIGAAERLLEMAIGYAKLRTTFGKPLADRQSIQWMLADSEVEIEAARWLTLHAAWRAEQGLDVRHEASIAKLYASNMAHRVVDRVLQIHGGMGYSKELPIERWYREIRLWRIFEGPDEIQRHIIARNLIKGHVKIPKDI